MKSQCPHSSCYYGKWNWPLTNPCKLRDPRCSLISRQTNHQDICFTHRCSLKWKVPQNEGSIMKTISKWMILGCLCLMKPSMALFNKRICSQHVCSWRRSARSSRHVVPNVLESSVLPSAQVARWSIDGSDGSVGCPKFPLVAWWKKRGMWKPFHNGYMM